MSNQEYRVMADEKHHRAADALHRLAAVLRNATRNLERDGGRGPIATAVDRAAAGVDSISMYVRETNFPTMLRDAGRLARRRPELLLAGGFLGGLLLGRYLETSRRPAQRWTSTGRWLEALQKGTQVVAEAADTLKQGVEARGLNPGNIAEKVSESRLAKHVATAGDRYWRK